jgi:hypothetical protein
MLLTTYCTWKRIELVMRGTACGKGKLQKHFGLLNDMIFVRINPPSLNCGILLRFMPNETIT